MSAPFARSASILGGIIGRYLHLLYAEEPHAVHYRRLCLIMRAARERVCARARSSRYLQSRTYVTAKRRHKESAFLPSARS